MSLLNMKLCASLAALAVMAAAPSAFASDKVIDHASLEVGGGAKVQMVRFGVQKEWNQRWFQSNGTHLSGYWDASIAQWRGNAYQNVDGQHQNITNVGFTPVFRFQADDMTGWYGEAGIGLNLLSKRYDNDSNRLSTAFQFGDHLGAGYVFANQWDVGMKIQHFSNGGYKKPNSGVNFLVLKASRPF
ncbi:MAG TPA: acyloxyacyl hydrolase [Telluria sp.]